MTLKFNNNTKKKQEVYENMIILIYAFCERNSVNYDIVEDAFCTFILNRNLKSALSDAEYYSVDSNLIENDYFGNFLKISRNKYFEIYSREHSMKTVFQNAKSLIDVLVNAKVSTSKIRDFIQEINFSLDFNEHEIHNIQTLSLEIFNAINIVDNDCDKIA